MHNAQVNSLMRGRLGLYSQQPGQDAGVETRDQQFTQRGGYHQQERMIKDKRRSLDKATLYSYQAADVRDINAKILNTYRALINPNKLKQDYDDKIVSVGFEAKFQPGTVFEWVGTHTYWLVYLQDLTELAYFRGDIRKCSYEIAWKDDDGEHKTHAAIRGPVETKINFIQKHGISVDEPNYSLNILMPKNEETLKYFTRYSKFYLQNDPVQENKICWRVEAVDWISMPGVLEINAVEYYSNKVEDDIKNGIVGGLVVEEKNPNTEEVEDAITGETFIKPKKRYRYQFTGSMISDWKIKTDLPLQCWEIDEHCIELMWLKPVSGQFTLSYGDFEKVIVVESLF